MPRGSVLGEGKNQTEKEKTGGASLVRGLLKKTRGSMSRVEKKKRGRKRERLMYVIVNLKK